jgi:trimethylamine--corrinoid protein Co-methyltransferase
MTSSVEMLVISAEVIAIVGRMVEGLETTDEALAVEAIHRVQPGGQFLMDEHTLKNFRRELFKPTLVNYQNFAAWQAAGATSMLDAAERRAKELLESESSPPMAEDRQRKVLEILRR